MQHVFLNDFAQVLFEDTPESPDFPETNTERNSKTETVGDSGPFGIFQGALWVRSYRFSFSIPKCFMYGIFAYVPVN